MLNERLSCWWPRHRDSCCLSLPGVRTQKGPLLLSGRRPGFRQQESWEPTPFLFALGARKLLLNFQWNHHDSPGEGFGPLLSPFIPLLFDSRCLLMAWDFTIPVVRTQIKIIVCGKLYISYAI